jgi:hypothetical protein
MIAYGKFYKGNKAWQQHFDAERIICNCRLRCLSHAEMYFASWESECNRAHLSAKAVQLGRWDQVIFAEGR